MAYSQNCIELVLCIFIGFLGVHKFYYGNWKCGVFYLLTAGFALLAVCIDIFLILYFWKEEEEDQKITNELKGKKGNLNKEKLNLYTSANDSIINYKYTSNKGKTACASASGLCLWLVLIIIVLLAVFFNLPFIKNDYYEEDYSSSYFEASYMDINDSRSLIEKEITVENKDRKKEYNKIKLYYPKELESKENKENFPVIIISNPEGVSYSKYESVFKHLASYGFVAVGNDDVGAENKTLPSIIDELHKINNEDEKLKNKFNLNEIGLVGYYQGTIPVISLLNNFPYNNSIYASYVSCLKGYYGISDKDLKDYAANISSAFFQTGPETDKYKDIMGKIQSSFQKDIPVYSFLRKHKKEGNMIIYGDAYMTAWFDFKLRRNSTTGREVFGDDGEIFKNNNWTHVEKK